MRLTIEQIRKVIKDKIPECMVRPEHTAQGHFYRDVPSGRLLASVTTKAGVLENAHLKKWAARVAVEYIGNNLELLKTADKALKEKIFLEAIMQHEDIRDDAGGVGTEGHKCIEGYLNSWIQTGIQPEDIRSFVTGQDVRLFAITRSAEAFCKDFGVIPVVSELFVRSLRYGFAGTLDSLMMLENVEVEGDKKCQHDWILLKDITKKHCFKCDRKVVSELALVDFKTSNSVDKPEYAMQVSAYWQALCEMTGLKPKHLLILQLDKQQKKYKVVRLENRSRAFKAFLNAGKIYDWLNDGNDKLPILNPKKIIDLRDAV